MKKRLMLVVLAFAVILPCFFAFSACDEEPEAVVTGISVEMSSTTYTLTENTITIPYGTKVSLSASDFKVTATLDNNETKVINAKTEKEEGFTVTSTLPTDDITPIGEYTVTISYGELDDVTITVKVVKAEVDMSNVAWDYKGSFTYDNTDKTVSLTGVPAGVSVTYEGVRTAKNAGTYTVTAKFTYFDGEHYNEISDKTLTWTIDKALVSGLESISTSNYLYDGNIKTANIVGLPSNVEVSEITGVKSEINAGTYNIVVSFNYTGENPENYQPIPNQKMTWTINPGEFTAIGTLALNQTYNHVYDGTSKTVEVNTSGLSSDVRVKEIVGTSATTAGNKSVCVELEYIGSNPNYGFVASQFISWSIQKAPLTITANNKTIYYGDDPIGAGVTVDGEANGEESLVLDACDISISYTKGGNVGTYDIVPYLTGTLSNYEVSLVNGDLTVSPATLTVSVGNKSIKYGDEASNDGYEITGYKLNDTIAVVGGTPSFTYGGYTNTSDVDTYEIGVTGLTATNYIFDIVEGTLTVNPADIDVTGVALNNNKFTYSNELKTVEVNATTIPQFLTTSITGNTGTDATTYTATITFTCSNANYNTPDPITRAWEIEQAEVDLGGVTLTSTSLIYNGYNQTVTATNLPAGAQVTGISGNIQKDVNSHYNVQITLTNTNNNYVPFVETITRQFAITPASLTITANPNTITYGEEASGAGVSYTGFVGEDNESVLGGELGYTSNYSQWGNVSSDYASYTIAPYGLTSNNYTISYASGVLTVNKAIVDLSTLKWPTQTVYTYTGNAIKPELINVPSNAVSVQYTYSAENPTNVGEYTVSATESLINSNYEVTGSIASFTYNIVKADVDTTLLSWNIPLRNQEGNVSNAVLEYTGTSYSLAVVNDTGIELTITYDGTQNPIDAGQYSLLATVSLTGNSNYNDFSVTLQLYYQIDNNPFETLKLNGTDISFGDLTSNLKYEVGDVITFTAKEGYALTNEIGEDITQISFEDIDSQPTIYVARGTDYQTAFTFSAYFVESLSIGTKELQKVSYEDVEYELSASDESLTIEFDDKYLDEHEITYTITMDTGETENSAISEFPFEVQNITEVVNISIYCDERTLVSVSIVPFAPISTFKVNTVTVHGITNERTLSLSHNYVYLENEAITSLNVSMKAGYENYTYKIFIDRGLTTAVNYSDLKNVNKLFIAVYDENDECAHVHEFYVTQAFTTGDATIYTNSNLEVINIGTASSYTFNLGAPSGSTFSALLNDSETLAITTVSTHATIKLSFTYNSVTYSLEKEVIILQSISSDAVLMNAYYYSPENGTYYVTSNKLGGFNVNTIKDFSFDSLTLDPWDGYEIVNKSLTQTGTDYLVLVTVKNTESNTEDTMYIYLEVDGSVDDNTSAVITIYGSTEPQVVEGTQITITDNRSQYIKVITANKYASVILKDSSGNEVSPDYVNNGNEYRFSFASTGEYTLTITATNGNATASYKITAESAVDSAQPLPDGVEISIEIKGKTLTSEDFVYSPTNNGIMGTFTDLTLSDVEDGTSSRNVEVTAFSCNMGGTLTYYSGTVISSTPFSVPVLDTGNYGEGLVFIYTVGGTNYTILILFAEESSDQGGSSSDPVTPVNDFAPITDGTTFTIKISNGTISETLTTENLTYSASRREYMARLGANMATFVTNWKMTVAEFTTNLSGTLYDSWNEPLDSTSTFEIGVLGFEFGFAGEIRLVSEVNGASTRILIYFADSENGSSSGETTTSDTNAELVVYDYFGNVVMPSASADDTITLTSWSSTYTIELSKNNAGTISLYNENQKVLVSNKSCVQYCFQTPGTYYAVVMPTSGDPRLITIIVEGATTEATTIAPMVTVVDGTTTLTEPIGENRFPTETDFDYSVDVTSALCIAKLVGYLGAETEAKISDGYYTLSEIITAYPDCVYLNVNKTNKITTLTNVQLAVQTDSKTGKKYVQFYIVGNGPEYNSTSGQVETIDKPILVVLYLCAKADISAETLPVKITVGTKEYGFKADNTEFYNFGDVTFDNDDAYLYVTLTPEELASYTETVPVKFTLNQVFPDYSYVILTEEGFYTLYDNPSNTTLDSLFTSGDAYRVTSLDDATVSFDTALLTAGYAMFGILAEGSNGTDWNEYSLMPFMAFVEEEFEVAETFQFQIQTKSGTYSCVLDAEDQTNSGDLVAVTTGDCPCSYHLTLSADDFAEGSTEITIQYTRSYEGLNYAIINGMTDYETAVTNFDSVVQTVDETTYTLTVELEFDSAGKAILFIYMPEMKAMMEDMGQDTSQMSELSFFIGIGIQIEE